MSASTDTFVLALGLFGFLCLLAGCCVLAGYLVCTGLPRRQPAKDPHADDPAHIDLFPW